MKSSFFSSPRAVLAALAVLLAPLTALAQQTINATAGQVGAAYSYKVTSDAVPPVIYSATGLPAGLGINASSGLITGTPSAAGTSTGSVSITNSLGQVNTANIVIVVNAAPGTPTISSPTTASGTVGVAFAVYNVTATIPAGANPVTSFNIGALPPGLVLGGTATAPTITSQAGGPTASGTYTVSLSANSASGTGASKTLTITIAPAAAAPAITNTVASVSTATTDAFSYQVTASNTPTSFAASGLPLGLSINTSSGRITGTATVAGIYTASLTATNAAGTSSPYTLTVSVGSVPVISSTLTASGTFGTAFSFNVTATNSPTSFNIGALPAGLSANTTTGAISGTPTAIGTTSVTLSANNATGTGSAVTLVITVTAPASVISSTLSAAGIVGTAFSYGVTATNTPTSYSIGALPAGLTANTTTGLISGVPTTPGVTSVTLSASNIGGAGPASTLVITINSANTGPTPPPIVNPPPVGAPVIATQPIAQTAVERSSVTFSVSATGSGLNFQWSKNGAPISGAQSASLVFASVTAADAGTYSVYVSNTGGAVTSSSVALTVTAAPAVVVPTISAQPIAASVIVGRNATLSVTAAGTAPLTYQWRKDGAAIAGATTATLNLNEVTTSQAGSYSVVVTNSAGSVTSSAAVLTVTSAPFAGTYFGSFAGNGGVFGLLVRPDRTGIFLGFASASKLALLSKDLVVEADGSFSVTQRAATVDRPVTQPAVAAAASDITITGKIAANGTLSGAVPTLNLTFSAPAATSSGATAAVAGFYQAGAAGKSDQSMALVGPAGEVLVVTTSGATADGGRGAITAAGAITLTTAANVSVTGSVAQGTLTANAGSQVFAGTTDSRNEKLINISARSFTGTVTDTLIAGFVIAGTEPKPVLVRAVGPTLATFGVNGALSAVRLEVFRGGVSVAVGTDWGAPSNNPTNIAAIAARVGAFGLPAGSRDAALALNLTPGNYTAVITGQTGASGVAMVEVYDATEGSIPPAQRIINISTRATAGTSDNTLISGFYVTGSVPKRVLIRGIGPALTQFGVSGALARPQLSVAAANNVLAQNTGLATSSDAAAIAAASVQVGAFALPANALDSAILINLAPGAYTAQVSGVGASTGVALIEIYEVP